MAGFMERISVIVDAKVDGFTSGFKKMREDIAQADTMRGKFAAGWAGVAGQVKANAGALAATAGASLVAFGVQAVNAFTDTAKAALDMGKATGLSTEQASRWIAVGDDFEVTAEQLTAAMLRLGKGMDGAAMAKYGIATRDAAGNAKDANEVFLDVLETLNNTAPGERAKVGAELLGRGWAGIAPILGKSRAEYEKMLGAVEEGQVITTDEARKAEKWRLAQDKLADALGEVTQAVGEQVAELSPLISRLADVVNLMNQITPSSEVPKIADHLNALAVAAEASGDAIQYLVDKGYSVKAAEAIMADYRGSVQEVAVAFDAAGDAGDRGADGVNEFGDSARDAAKHAEKARDRTRDLRKELDDIADSNAALDVADQFDELAQKAAEAYAKGVAGSEDAEQAQRDHQRAINDTKARIAEYGTEVLKLPAQKVTDLLALIDQGKLKEAEDELNRLARIRTASIIPTIGYGGGAGGTGANGTGASGDTGNLGGKTGTIESARGGGTVVNIGPIHVTAGMGADGAQIGRQIADALQAWVNDGGRGLWMAA